MPFAERTAGPRRLFGVRSLYVLPTGFGWLWLGGAGLLQVVGIQLQSNGALLMSFLLLGLFLLAMHLTVFNLRGLELACGEPPPGFAGEPLPYPVWLGSGVRRFQLELEFPAGRRNRGPFLGPGTATPLTIDAGRQLVAPTWTPAARGRQRPGRLRVRSTAPLGLFRCWGIWEPAATQLIYPARRPGPVREGGLNPQRDGSGRGEEGRDVEGSGGSEEWRDLRPHRPEEGPARVAWKTVARGRGTHAKVFASPTPAGRMLAPAGDVPWEQALEHLSARIWSLSAAGEPFALVLDGRMIPAGSGVRHRDRCLAALAEAP